MICGSAPSCTEGAEVKLLRLFTVWCKVWELSMMDVRHLLDGVQMDSLVQLAPLTSLYSFLLSLSVILLPQNQWHSTLQRPPQCHKRSGEGPC